VVLKQALKSSPFQNAVKKARQNVDATVIWNYDGSIIADLNVSGTGTVGGTLHVEWTWQVPGPVGNFSVTGSLGGKPVAVLVPEAWVEERSKQTVQRGASSREEAFLFFVDPG